MIVKREDGIMLSEAARASGGFEGLKVDDEADFRLSGVASKTQDYKKFWKKLK